MIPNEKSQHISGRKIDITTTSKYRLKSESFHSTYYHQNACLYCILQVNYPKITFVFVYTLSLPKIFERPLPNLFWVNLAEIQNKIKVVAARIGKRRQERRNVLPTNAKNFELNQYRDKKKLLFLENQVRILGWLQKSRKEIKDNPLGMSFPKRCKNCILSNDNFFEYKKCNANFFIYKELSDPYHTHKYFNDSEIAYLKLDFKPCTQFEE